MANEGIKQHKRMAEGDGPTGGDFGVSELPGRARIERDEPAAKMLSDSERAMPPAVGGGRDRMGSAAECDHGPHRHSKGGR